MSTPPNAAWLFLAAFLVIFTQPSLAQPNPAQLNPAKPSTAGITKIEVAPNKSPKVVALWSMMRTGSTHVAGTLGQHHCIWNSNEVLHAAIKHLQWDPLDLRTLVNDSSCEPQKTPLAFMLKAHEAACSRIPSEKDKKLCGERCMLVIKLHDVMGLKRDMLEELVLHPDVAVIKLIRHNVEHQFCSFIKAKTTGIWHNRKGNANQLDSHAECANTTEKHKNSFEAFKLGRSGWYSKLYDIMNAKPFLTLPYDATTNVARYAPAYANMIGFLGLGDVVGQELVVPQDEADPDYGKTSYGVLNRTV